MGDAKRRLWGAVWVALAVIAIAVAGAAYLRPSRSAPVARPSPASGAPRAVPRLVLASFADADNGYLVFEGEANGAPTVQLTRDGGRTWRPAPAGALPYLGFWFAGTSLLAVELGQSAGSARGPSMEMSADGGRIWRPMGLPTAAAFPGAGFVRTMAFADARDGWLLVSPPGGGDPTLWRTRDGGASWTYLPALPPFDGRPIPAMVFVNAMDGVLAVERQGAGPLLLTTGDGGANWRQSAALDFPEPGLTAPGVSLVASGQRVLAVLNFGSVTGLAVHVYTALSEDGGRTWSALRRGPVLVQRSGGFVGLVAGEVDWLAVLDDAGLSTSDDGGASWSDRAAQFPARLLPQTPVSGGRREMFVLAAHADSGNQPLPGASLVLLRSGDGGTTWNTVALPAFAGSG